MVNFVYGDDLTKINNFISELIKKNNFVKNTLVLNELNSSEILGTIDTPSLFGDKYLFVIDVTDTESEILENFIPKISANSDVIIIFEGEMDKRSKEFKLLSKLKTLNFSQIKSNGIFNFVDTLFLGDPKKTYQEYENLLKNKEEDLAIFNMIVSNLRSISYIKFNSSLANKIPPFKIGLMQKIANNYTEEELSNIYKILTENDLKFKNGELTADLLLTHTINTVLKHGNIK